MLVDWLGVVADVVAAAVAVIAVTFAYKAHMATQRQLDATQKQLEMEQNRDSRQQKFNRREQAAQVSAWRVQQPVCAESEGKPKYRYGTCLRNGSSASVFNVKLLSKRLDGVPYIPLLVTTLPPGTYVVWSDNNRWSNLIAIEDCAKNLEFAVRGAPVADWVMFDDSHGHIWLREADGRLTELTVEQGEQRDEEFEARERKAKKKYQYR